MKTLIASLLALGLVAGTANARAPFDRINDTAPRSDKPFVTIDSTAPRSPFDRINDTAPRSPFDRIDDQAPRSDKPFITIDTTAP